MAKAFKKWAEEEDKEHEGDGEPAEGKGKDGKKHGIAIMIAIGKHNESDRESRANKIASMLKGNKNEKGKK